MHPLLSFRFGPLPHRGKVIVHIVEVLHPRCVAACPCAGTLQLLLLLRSEPRVLPLVLLVVHGVAQRHVSAACLCEAFEDLVAVRVAQRQQIAHAHLRGGSRIPEVLPVKRQVSDLLFRVFVRRIEKQYGDAFDALLLHGVGSVSALVSDDLACLVVDAQLDRLIAACVSQFLRIELFARALDVAPAGFARREVEKILRRHVGDVCLRVPRRAF